MLLTYILLVDLLIFSDCLFFFSSIRRHTRCALVTGVQTCALPICLALVQPLHYIEAWSRCFAVPAGKLPSMAAIMACRISTSKARISAARWRLHRLT